MTAQTLMFSTVLMVGLTIVGMVWSFLRSSPRSTDEDVMFIERGDIS